MFAVSDPYPYSLLSHTHLEQCYILIFHSNYDFFKVVWIIEPVKARVYDMISICMQKLYGPSISWPLWVLYWIWIFFFLMEKANVPTDHNIRDKQLLKNQRPISLLPNRSKIFERLVYDKMFQFFMKRISISSSVGILIMWFLHQSTFVNNT